MPSVVRKVGPPSKPWCVVEKRTGEIKGCSATKADAERSRRAREGGRHGWKATGKPAIDKRGK